LHREMAVDYLQVIITIAKKLGPHNCSGEKEIRQETKLKLRRKSSRVDQVNRKIEKLERNTDNKQK